MAVCKIRQNTEIALSGRVALFHVDDAAEKLRESCAEC